MAKNLNTAIREKYQLDCLYFNGYKPCQFKRACSGCKHYSPVSTNIAIISLEAMGAVLRSTALLPAIHRAYPGAKITWITLKNTFALLKNNPLIHTLLDARIPSALSPLRFDVAMCVDKSLEAAGILQLIQAEDKRGFTATELGAIVPVDERAQYQYDLGLDDDLKFFKNQKSENQQNAESLGLAWEKDEYVLHLDDAEKREVSLIRQGILSGGTKKIIGFNTGCSNLFPYKKFTVERSIELVKKWRQIFPDAAVFLLGGPEDQQRQESMAQAFAGDQQVVNTPTTAGIRAGLQWMDACDLVFSGDSLGMHMAIGLKKPVIAWFGLTCPQEIELYGRGIKLHAKVNCSPCWQRSCDKEPKCYNEVSIDEVVKATQELL